MIHNKIRRDKASPVQLQLLEQKADTKPQGVTRPNRRETSNVFSTIKERDNIMDCKYKATLYKFKKISYSADAEKHEMQMQFYCQKSSDLLENHKNNYHPSEKFTLSYMRMSYEMKFSW